MGCDATRTRTETAAATGDRGAGCDSWQRERGRGSEGVEVYIQPSSFDPAVRHRRVLVRASRPSLLVSLRPRGYLNGHQFRLQEVRHCGCGVCHPPTHPSPTHPPTHPSHTNPPTHHLSIHPTTHHLPTHPPTHTHTHGGGFDGDDDDASSNES